MPMTPKKGTRISLLEKKRAQKLRAAGDSWEAVGRELGRSERQLKTIAKQERWPSCTARAQIVHRPCVDGAQTETVDHAQLGETIKNQLAEDAVASVKALTQLEPVNLELRDWERRERIIASVQKRADDLLEFQKKSEPLFNIAVMSQLPPPHDV